MREVRLWSDVDELLSPRQQVLANRGIPLNQQDEWLQADEHNFHNWRLIDENKIINACKLLHQCVEDDGKIQVVVDCDQDGYASSAILINYLFMMHPQWATCSHVSYIMHEGKEHGLRDVMSQIEDDTNIVFCPDGGSNDRECHKILRDRGITCIVLDHHPCDRDSDDAIVINTQLTKYPNKALTGAGVVWKFCQAYDELYGYDAADMFMDLCMLGNIGDMADYRKLEIRAIVNVGRRQDRNGWLQAMEAANKYVIDKHGGISYMGLAFGVVPFLNALVRVGSQEDKDLVFKAMLDYYANTELIAAAVKKLNAMKRLQTKIVNQSLEMIQKVIEEEDLTSHKLLLLPLQADVLDREVTGLVANKLQSLYHMPAVVMTENPEDGIYYGSIRNYSKSSIADLRKDLEDTGKIEWCRGHGNAAGIAVSKDDVKDLLLTFDANHDILEEQQVEHVDYYWEGSIGRQDVHVISELGKLAPLYGQQVDEAKVAITDLRSDACSVSLLSPDRNPTLKIVPRNLDMAIIKFKSSQGEYDRIKRDKPSLSLIGTCNLNEWNGKITPQILVDDFEMEENENADSEEESPWW